MVVGLTCLEKIPIITKSAPSTSFEAFINNIHEWASSDNIDEPQISVEQHQHKVYKIYHLPLGDILAGKGLRAAHLKGGRYLFQDKTGRVHGALIEIDGEGHRFNSIESDELIHEFIHHLQDLHADKST